MGTGVLGVGFAGDGFDGLADEGEAKVAVLEVALGGVERRLVGDGGADLLAGGEGVVRLGPVGELGLARQASGVREGTAESDGDAVFTGGFERRPGEIGGERLIETDTAGFVLLHE